MGSSNKTILRGRAGRVDRKDLCHDGGNYDCIRGGFWPLQLFIGIVRLLPQVCLFASAHASFRFAWSRVQSCMWIPMKHTCARP